MLAPVDAIPIDKIRAVFVQHFQEHAVADAVASRRLEQRWQVEIGDLGHLSVFSIVSWFARGRVPARVPGFDHGPDKNAMKRGDI